MRKIEIFTHTNTNTKFVDNGWPVFMEHAAIAVNYKGKHLSLDFGPELTMSCYKTKKDGDLIGNALFDISVKDLVNLMKTIN